MGISVHKKININRNLPPGKYKVYHAFPDIRHDRRMEELFGSATIVEDVLSTVHIHVIDFPHYMNVRNDDGTINIGIGHLRHSKADVLYLDILHELYHVKQQREGVDLYPPGVAYVDRPTEIDAYRFAVNVARQMNLTDQDILDYLWVEWMSPDDFRKLANRVNMDIP